MAVTSEHQRLEFFDVRELLASTQSDQAPPAAENRAHRKAEEVAYELMVLHNTRTAIPLAVVYSLRQRTPRLLLPLLNKLIDLLWRRLVG